MLNASALDVLATESDMCFAECMCSCAAYQVLRRILQAGLTKSPCWHIPALSGSCICMLHGTQSKLLECEGKTCTALAAAMVAVSWSTADCSCCAASTCLQSPTQALIWYAVPISQYKHPLRINAGGYTVVGPISHPLATLQIRTASSRHCRAGSLRPSWCPRLR